jgi:hypothetical protein
MVASSSMFCDNWQPEYTLRTSNINPGLAGVFLLRASLPCATGICDRDHKLELSTCHG